MKNLGFPLLLFLILLSETALSYNTDILNVVPGKLEKSVKHHGYERLSIYCYDGVAKSPLRLWRTVQLQIIIEGNDWESYIGFNGEDVQNEYEEKRSSWTFNLPFSRKANIFNLNPFNGTCIGIQTSQDHDVILHVVGVDAWKAITFIAGLILFFAAKRLSANPVFHYTCGIILGVSMSFMVFVYFTSKIIPTKPAVYGFLVGGWAISLYVVKVLLTNIRTIVSVYHNYVLGYFVAAALVSFAVCYRYGPVSNQRTLALIRWALQGAGLVAIFQSSDFFEAVLAINILVLVIHNFPVTFCRWLYTKWYSRFPPPCKLLTEDEYHEKGIIETKKALEELKKYCSSPECKHWKTVLALKQPTRFAEFIEGASHISDDELSEYSKLDFVSDDDSE